MGKRNISLDFFQPVRQQNNKMHGKHSILEDNNSLQKALKRIENVLCEEREKKKNYQKMCIFSVFMLVTYIPKLYEKVLHIVQQLFLPKGLFARVSAIWLLAILAPYLC